MNLSPGIEQLKREDRRRMRRKIEDAALILGGIAALVVVWLRG